MTWPTLGGFRRSRRMNSAFGRACVRCRACAVCCPRSFGGFSSLAYTSFNTQLPTPAPPCCSPASLAARTGSTRPRTPRTSTRRSLPLGSKRQQEPAAGRRRAAWEATGQQARVPNETTTTSDSGIGNNCMGTTLRITRKGAIRCMMTPYECPLRRFVGFAVVRKWHVIANCKTQDRSQ